uniref:Suppressor of mek1 n=1 Tax=Colletotrichum fructicola (strain Nara gc5) TaxID=1213859 RepID=L2GG23_COLFN
MMAQPVPHHATDKKRVKVYELRNNDWFDRGTGFCTAAFMQTEDGQPRDPRVIVESEDHPDRLLLETKICKEDGFQKQQGKLHIDASSGAYRLTEETETLIVWTEPSNGIDMALSFQEAEGCALIWKFVNSVQQTFQGGLVAADDSLSDDLAMELPSTISLPAAEIGNLPEIEASMRIMSQTASGRDALVKCLTPPGDYIARLLPLVEMAEDLESLPDLHRLCNIMKNIILLNDTAIIEAAVSDAFVIGVVGALEYDPDFPSHKRITDTGWKIHQTYRLQYLKDVVLARILDDPTFSVLNSLIFFNQVDIVQHLQGNSGFLSELFSIFKPTQPDQKKKKDAVLFIQQCCAIAKNLQPQTLFANFLHHGLLQVINFGLRHNDVGVRVGATDVLVALIDHDPQLIRHTIYRQITERTVPLTDSLIDLLLVECDLGVKSQISDAVKVLLDVVLSQHPPPPEPVIAPKASAEFNSRRHIDVQQDVYVNTFYINSAPRLFKPLFDLKERKDMTFPLQQASIFTYLIEILCFFIRQHGHRAKQFILEHDVLRRVAQLLACPEKYLKLVAVRFFRTLANLQDSFWDKHIMDHGILLPLLDLVSKSMPRDNLLSSACLEFFVYINAQDNKKDYCKFLVHNYRERLVALSYEDTFKSMVANFDQTQGFTLDLYNESEEDHTKRMGNPHTRLAEQLHVDSEQDEYFNTSDDEENPEAQAFDKMNATNGFDGSTTSSKPLVDYPSDDEADENAENTDPEVLPTSGEKQDGADGTSDTSSESSSVAPPERLSEKRRREEDDDDELGKMMQNKRRNSSSAGSNASMTSGIVRKKKSFADRTNPAAPKKIAISISPSVKTGGTARSDDES